MSGEYRSCLLLLYQGYVTIMDQVVGVSILIKFSIDYQLRHASHFSQKSGGRLANVNIVVFPPDLCIQSLSTFST